MCCQNGDPHSCGGKSEFPFDNKPWEYRPESLLDYPTWERTVTLSDGSVISQWGSGTKMCGLQNRPQMYFTCKNRPRNAKSTIFKIQKTCSFLANCLTAHHENKRRPCSCSYKQLKTGKCALSDRGTSTARNVQGMIRAHDYWCTCGCFDI